MRRKALIVSGAILPEQTATDVLERFGFLQTEWAASIEDALSALRDGHYDLLIVSLEHASTPVLAALDREIRRLQTTFVIATAPQADPELILRAMRSGIHEFLPLPLGTADFSAAVDRLMRRNQTSVQRGRVIAVHSAKGGLGATTIAVNIARSASANRRDIRVAVADLVVAGGDVGVVLNLRSTYDMADVAAKLDRIDSGLLHSLLTPSSGGMWVLPAPDDPEMDSTLDASATTTIIELLRGEFALTVLDSEHHMSERTLSALDAADRIVLVTELSVTALRSTQRTLGLCRRLGYPDEKVCVVVNRFQSGEVLSPADASGLLKADIFWKLPNDYRTVAAALAKGVPLTEHDPASKLAVSFSQLAAKLAGSSARVNGHVESDDAISHPKRFFGFGKKRG
ncbi:MAG: AAA family ATPase [Gemmatimonadaceae bacterium]